MFLSTKKELTKRFLEVLYDLFSFSSNTLKYRQKPTSQSLYSYTENKKQFHNQEPSETDRSIRTITYSMRYVNLPNATLI